MTRYVRQDSELPRRRFITAAMGTTVGIGGLSLLSIIGGVKPADTLTPEKTLPARGDVLVYAAGPNAKKQVKAADLKEGVAVLALAADPKTLIPRDAAQSSVVLVRLKPAEIKASSKKNAAGSVVAYSSQCTHQGCPAQEIGSLGQGKGNIICTCHGSIYDPRDNATVLGGPAPRRLAALPLKLDASGQLLAAGTFTSKVGPGK